MNIIRSIRLNLFKVTQSEMATIVGVTQATVSRWENGVAPSLDDLAAIRSAALARCLDWDDRFFFEPTWEAAE